MTRWKVRQRASGHEVLAELVAYWEVYGDPISDKYMPDDMSAEDLLALWVRLYGTKVERVSSPFTGL
jgi:hypothetical protein